MCNTQPLLNRIHSFKPSSPACKERAENRAMIPHSYLWIGTTAWHHHQQTAKRERESRRQSNDTTQVPVNRDHSLTTLSLDCKEREQKTAMIPHSYLWTGITAWHHHHRTAKRERAEDRAMIPHRYLWTGTTAKNHHHLPAKGEQKTELWYHTATSEQGSQLDSIKITGLQRQRERAEDRALISHCYLWTGITTWQHHDHWTAKTMQSHSIYTATSDTES